MPDFCLRQNPSESETPEDDPEWVADGCEGVVEELSLESADPATGGPEPDGTVCGGCGLPILYEPDGDPVRFIDETGGSTLVRDGAPRYLISRVSLSPDTPNYGLWVREGTDVYTVFGAFLKENIGGAYVVRSETGTEGVFLILDLNQREYGGKRASSHAWIARHLDPDEPKDGFDAADIVGAFRVQKLTKLELTPPKSEIPLAIERDYFVHRARLDDDELTKVKRKLGAMTKRAKTAEARIVQLEQELGKAVEARMLPTTWERLEEENESDAIEDLMEDI